MFRVPYLSQLMRFWYLSHRRPAKAQVSLLIRAARQSLGCLHTWSMEAKMVQPKIRHLAPLDGWACTLEEFEEWVYGSTIISWAGSFHFCLQLGLLYIQLHMSPVKRICVFEHSVMTNFNCMPSHSEGPEIWLSVWRFLLTLLVWASSGGSGETARMRRLAWTFAARIGDKYQIRLTRSISFDNADYK